MKRIMTALLLLPLTLGGALLAMSPIEDKTDPKALQAFASQGNQFGVELFQLLRQQPGNVFLSPYSISSCLAMTSAGARGTTAEQMTKVLHLPGEVDKYAALEQGLMASILDNPKGYDIRIANALWGQNQHPFEQNYISLLQRSFRAEGRTLDFAKDPEASRQTINRWVEAQTNDRIKDLLAEGTIKTDTRLVLTNAIYFKGKWKDPFEAKWTKSETFYGDAGKETKVNMMNRRDYMVYAETDLLQMVEMHYEGNRLSMVVLLPKKKDGLAEVEASLTAESLQKLVSTPKYTSVNLKLPKHKTTYSASLVKPLATLGMTDAFEFGKADFSGIDGGHELFISDVIHKAFCEINETGTEAAAATATMMRAGSARPAEPKVFQADHPYLYLIRDVQTGSILFLGRVSQPE